jgi:pSer/pThr/pTyr-binding forkhead associated (FHA) protein
MTQRCRIGRNPGNDLIIQDRAADDFHAVITVDEQNEVFIEDLSTRFGTYVNGARIQSARLLPGDEVQIGFSRIDWESQTNVAPQLSDIEIRPNLSVPVRRPSISSLSSTFPVRSEERIESNYAGEATRELAHEMMENAEFVERIEKESRPLKINQEKLPEQTLDHPPVDETVNIPSEGIVEELPVNQQATPPSIITSPEFPSVSESNITVEITNDYSAEVKQTFPKASIKQPMSETLQIILVLGLTAALVLCGWLFGSIG